MQIQQINSSGRPIVLLVWSQFHMFQEPVQIFSKEIRVGKVIKMRVQRMLEFWNPEIQIFCAPFKRTSWGICHFDWIFGVEIMAKYQNFSVQISSKVNVRWNKSLYTLDTFTGQPGQFIRIMSAIANYSDRGYYTISAILGYI